MNEERITPQYHSILDVCIDAVLTGTASIEDCLVQYPDYADLLEPELQVLVLTSRLKSPELSDAAVASLETRLLAQMPTGTSPRIIPFSRFLPASRAAAAVMIVFLLAFSSGAGVVAASANALPGDSLYVVKRFWEDVITAIVTFLGRAGDVWLHLATTRLLEARTLAVDGRLTQEVVDNLYWTIDRALTTTDAAVQPDVDDLLIRAQAILTEQIAPIAANVDLVPVIELVDTTITMRRTGSVPQGTQPSSVPSNVALTATITPTDVIVVTVEASATAMTNVEVTAVSTSTPRIPPTATRTPTVMVIPSNTPTNTPLPSSTPSWTPLPPPSGQPTQQTTTAGTPIPNQGRPTRTPTPLPNGWDWVRQTQEAVRMTQTAGPPETEEPTP